MLFPVQVLFAGMNVVGIEASEDMNKRPGDLLRTYSWFLPSNCWASFQ